MTLKLLPADEREDVTKEDVIKMELAFIEILDFNLHMLSPLPFLERFLRLINLEEDDYVSKLSKEVCFMARCSHKYLNLLPSEIAAGAYVIA